VLAGLFHLQDDRCVGVPTKVLFDLPTHTQLNPPFAASASPANTKHNPTVIAAAAERLFICLEQLKEQLKEQRRI
jgi:hypothetical protein